MCIHTLSKDERERLRVFHGNMTKIPELFEPHNYTATTHLEFHIFTMTATFYYNPIYYHNLEIGCRMDITMSFFSHSPMNGNMGVVTVN